MPRTAVLTPALKTGVLTYFASIPTRYPCGHLTQQKCNMRGKGCGDTPWREPAFSQSDASALRRQCEVALSRNCFSFSMEEHEYAREVQYYLEPISNWCLDDPIPGSTGFRKQAGCSSLRLARSNDFSIGHQVSTNM